MYIFTRTIEKELKDRLFQNKVIILYGARQVGKTTLVKKILSEYAEKGKYLNCENLSVQQGLATEESSTLKSFLGDNSLIVLDEAQKIPNIGLKLKLLVDTFPELQIIATGSSSFDLANSLSEPLTGRTFHFMLTPLSVEEIRSHTDLFTVSAQIEKLMRFGSYPEIYSLTDDVAMEHINEIASAYLYKDILQFEGIKKSSIVQKLLQLLALQLGQEVSYNELATQLKVSRPTVQKYLDILEKSFVVFTLRAFSRNKRKEISKSVKVYFYDNGIRNSLIQNFNPLSLRDDVGALWENFCISERYKYNVSHRHQPNSYFWRTYDQKEVDYVEEANGEIHGFECKWNPEKSIKIPRTFIETYSADVTVVTPKNCWNFFGV
ncbi:MAG: ATP-binding protein [bacterium]|nr:ATP-binding protein [bacterium]